MVAEGFTIRVMTEEDIPLGLQLGEMSGWNQLPADWLRIYQYQPDGCFVGMVDGTPVATISTTTYGRELAWIGMMLVHPDYRRRGVATALMRHAVNWLELRGVRCIKLDATPAGATVYEQLGFQREWDFQRYAGTGTAPEGNLNGEKVPFVVPELDATAFGVDRSARLLRLAEDSWVAQLEDDFGMLRPGRLAGYVGPVIARTPQAAEELLIQLLSRARGTVFWDVPEPNPQALSIVNRLGFHPVRPLTRMWYGDQLVSGRLELQYGVASPATG